MYTVYIYIKKQGFQIFSDQTCKRTHKSGNHTKKKERNDKKTYIAKVINTI